MRPNENNLPPEIAAGVKDAAPLIRRAALFSFAVNLLMLTGPIYMLQLYDRVLASRSVMTLVAITILMIGMFVAMGVFDYVRTALVAQAAQRFDDRVGDRAFDSAVEATRLVAGKASDAPLRDVKTIKSALSSGAVTAFFDAPFAPLYLILIFMLHWSLGLLSLVGAAALVALAVMNERQTRRALSTALEKSAVADALSSAVIRNSASVDAMGMRGALRTRWRNVQESSADISSDANDVMNRYGAVTKMGRTLLQSLILGAGAFLAIKQMVTPGVMIAASIIAARALAPVELAIGQWRTIGAAIASWKRLTGFLATTPAPKERVALPAPKGALKVEKIFVQPAGATKPVVKGVSLDLAPGEAIGIIGPSGAGKSTLARAIVGVERVVAGEIRLNGANLLTWDKEELGPFVGYLPQEPELFAGTIAENIARFAKDASDAEIVAAATDAAALDLVLAQPDGFETNVGDFGRSLSVGQRQRIGLARALFRKPILVVLDEPNANLDAEGEAALSSAILALKQRGACIIIVAHRPSAIAHVDRLLFVVDGEQRAYGPRDEVLSRIAGGRVASINPATPIRRETETEQNVGIGKTGR